MSDCKGCGNENHFDPRFFKKTQNATRKLVERVRSLDDEDRFDVIRWFKEQVDESELEDKLAVDRLFGEDDEARLAVPHIDASKIVSAAQSACKVIRFLNDKVCPVVGKM